MQTTESVQLLKEIESKYRVDQICYDGIQLWPIFRVYIGSQLHFDADRSVRLNKDIALRGFSNLFRGFKNLFRSFDYLSFTSSDQRKEIDSFMFERADFVDAQYGKMLSVETPSPAHFRRERYKSSMTSHMLLYAIEFGLIKFMRLNSSKFTGMKVLNNILEDYNVSIDPTYLTKRFKAQFKVMRGLNRIWKVNRVFMTTPYTKYGYVYYFKNEDIPVIEFQHGVISAAHNAYNVYAQVEKNFYPDYLLTFGELEHKVFESSFYIQPKHCFAVGSFYIDYISNLKEKNIVKQRYPDYQNYVAIVLQDMYESELFEFMQNVFDECEQSLFILIPRQKKENYYRKHFDIPENTVFFSKLNTYQIIKMCDVHTTINSTTAIEAPSLGTPNILINNTGLAVQYYGSVLVNEEVNKFANTPEDYIKLLREFKKIPIDKAKKSNDHIFKTNFKLQLNSALKRIDSDVER